MKKEIIIEGMSCNHCVKHVREALEALQGVKNVKVSLAKQNAIFEVESINDEVIKDAIAQVGYDAITIKNI